MIFKQLSLNYLSSQIGISNFNLFKNSYNKIVDDGHFDKSVNDKDLASLLFENTIPDDFFSKKDNLKKFCYALPLITQEIIIQNLNLKDLEELKWNEETADFFLNEYNLNQKFYPKDSKEKIIDSGYTIFNEPKIKFKKLKDYQSDVFFKTYSYLKVVPYARCIIQMPTGSGKTRTAMEIVSETINNTKGDVLWLANTQELCDQAYFSFLEVWEFLKQIKAQAVNHLRYNPKMDSIDKEIPCFHVMTLQSLNAKDRENKLKKMGLDIESIELVIVDEAHISIAPTYKKAIEYLLKDGSKLLGLTATPGRSLNQVDKSQNQELSDFYFNELFELNTGNDLPIEFLRKKGILCNAIFHSIEGSQIEHILTPSQLKKCIDNREVPSNIEEILTNDVHRNTIIFDQLITLLAEGKKIIFFGTSINHSKLMTSLIKLKGYKAEHIDGNSGKFRSSIIEDFRNGEIQILCNYGVLSTGFDDPKIDVVFMARPTNSIVLYSQIIGRGLRGPVIGGTDSCEIFTVFDNISDLPNNNQIYSYFDEYFIN
ncbi:DEAD/DEAH box helicase [Salegentibacter mishustinae]|uniref:DEAD/DEAH box helicase n=1 Tax=Salegentibacter mishustinae TaxID=270918 RepID=UPI0024911110|nr:DEAD/DEAH box helicase [Salegentibacter mishustinae]